MYGWSRSFMMHISRSKPKGMALPPAKRVESFCALSQRLARLNARTLSAVLFDMILAAPYLPVPLCRTMRTREQPPLPTVLPNCHGPMWVFLRPPCEALVLALDISESRLVLRGLLSSMTVDNRLCCGDGDGTNSCPCRTVSEPLADRSSLRGSGRGEDLGAACAFSFSPVLLVARSRWSSLAR